VRTQIFLIQTLEINNSQTFWRDDLPATPFSSIFIISTKTIWGYFSNNINGSINIRIQLQFASLTTIQTTFDSIGLSDQTTSTTRLGHV
jgi:hypothetical protein